MFKSGDGKFAYETYNQYTRYYEGKYIIKFSKINGIVHETYIISKDGKVYLEKYIDFKLEETIPLMAIYPKEVEI